MMILPQIQSCERSAAMPVLFPTCVPAKELNQIRALAEPIRELPPFAELPNPLASTALPSMTDYRSHPQHAPLQRERGPEVLEVVEPAPNRIVEILQVGDAEVERHHPLQQHVRQAARMALQCRTAALGGHVEKCPDGHSERGWYHSCGHRFCPRCAYRKQQTWLEKQRKTLLPVRPFHTTFTIPHDFNDLGWCNFKEMAALLFHTSAQALQALMKDPKRTGVHVGIIAALHPWDDRLLRHPHLHCLVTGGGLAPEGGWKASSQAGDQPYVVSAKALMQRFRRLFCRTLERMIKKEHLTLPEGYSKQRMLNTINKVNRTNWDVYVANPPEAGGPTTGEMVEYQAKAVAGGPLSETRIEGIERKVNEWGAEIAAGQASQAGYLSEPLMPNSRVESINQADARVIFRWGKVEQQSGRRVREETENLAIGTFMQRLLWHVTPPKWHAIRQDGLYTSVKKSELETLRALLPDVVESEADTQARSGKAKHEDERIPLDTYREERRHCPTCGKKLELCRVIPSSVSGKISPRDKARVRALRQARGRGG